jgi:hypothetical protein
MTRIRSAPRIVETVRDDEGGAAFHQVGESFLDLRFRLGIETRRGFVEDQDARMSIAGVELVELTTPADALCIHPIRFLTTDASGDNSSHM